MTEHPRAQKKTTRERLTPDLATLLLFALVVVLLLWITSELWLPHYGPD